MESNKLKHFLDWVHFGRTNILLYVLITVIGYFLVVIGPLLSTFILAFVPVPANYMVVVPHILMLLPILLLLLLVMLFLKHPWYSLWNAIKRFEWRLFGWGFLIMVLVHLLNMLYFSINDSLEYTGWPETITNSILLLLFICVGVLIQTLMEELYFRGLFMQATYRILPRFILVVGLQAFIFAKLHIGNVADWGTGFIAAVPYLIMGATFGYAVWRTGSLFFAWGLHFANNLFLTIIMNTKGDVVQHLGLFATGTPTIAHSIVFDSVAALLTVLVVEILYRNKFKDRSFCTMKEVEQP